MELAQAFGGARLKRVVGARLTGSGPQVQAQRWTEASALPEGEGGAASAGVGVRGMDRGDECRADRGSLWRRLHPALPEQSVREMRVESNPKARVVGDRQDDPNPERARRAWVEQTWPAIVKPAQARGAVSLFADEACFARWGSLSRTWVPRGQHPGVKTPGRRKGIKWFGAIEFCRGALDLREAVGYTRSATALRQLKTEGVPAEGCEHGAR
jgi:hypothetical protein